MTSGFDYQRQIVVKIDELTPQQKEIHQLQSVYNGTMFDGDRARKHPWNETETRTGRTIPEKERYPLFIHPIGQDIVDTHVSNLFGEQYFPKIKLDALTDGLFPGVVDADGSGDALGENSAMLQQLFDDFTEELSMSLDFSDLASEAITARRACLYLKIVAGKPKHEVLDYKWLDVVRDDEDPECVVSVIQQYVFTACGEDGKEREYWYRREITEEAEIHYEPQPKLKEKPDWDTVRRETVYHGLSFCPVIEARNIGDESIFDNKMAENIKEFIGHYNTLLCGSKSSSMPLYFNRISPSASTGFDVTYSPEQQEAAGKDINRGALVDVYGDQILPATADTAALEHHGKVCDRLASTIFHAAKVFRVQDDNDQSGVAISIRISPQTNQTLSYRAQFGRYVKQCAKMWLRIIAELHGREFMQENEDGEEERVVVRLKIPPTTQVPEYSDWCEYVKITLLWGDLNPETEETKGQKIQNAQGMKDLGFSEQASKEYVAHSVGVSNLAADEELKDQEHERDLERESAYSVRGRAAIRNQTAGV